MKRRAEIRRAVATFTGVAEGALVMGIDGCSAPNYAMPLRSLARAFARLAAPGDDPHFGAAPRTLADAMTAHPIMVAGERRSDLALMDAGRGDWVAKVGAEGVQAIGVRSRREPEPAGDRKVAAGRWLGPRKLGAIRIQSWAMHHSA